MNADDRVRAEELALDAAREAGELLLGYLGRIEREDVGTKSAARDLVTVADVESERGIVERIRAAFPDHAIEAEEEVRDARGDGLRWLVDPLDGTVNFVHGIPCFCVSIALYDGLVPLVAVVHAPRLEETFHARRGEGSYLRTRGGEPRRLRVSPAATIGEAVLATGFPYRRGELPNDNLGNFARVFHEARGLRRMGSAALDLAYAAAGRLDGFWELHLGPHDVAAGALLVREAGGVVTDTEGGDAWLYRGDVVAAGPALHGRLLERVTAAPERGLGTAP